MLSSFALHPRIYLSPPHLDGDEFRFVREAFESNWIAPVGPHLAAFEEEICACTGARHAVALSSGTAAIHLALVHLGVGPGDRVYCPTLTFVATANPIRYCGADPVFLDCERESWNLDPGLLAETLEADAARNRLPKAVLVADLFGQCADYRRIESHCAEHGVPLIEDAAEALGAGNGRRSAGTFGRCGVFSFNGNKIITTSGGGMLVTDDEALARHARKLATQARDPAVHYEHSELGYNYRMSNVVAAIGRGQLARLDAKVARRREHFAAYREALGDLPVTFQPEAPWGRSSRWLTCLTLDPEVDVTPWDICETTEAADIECRPIWKPMHRQPLYQGAETHGGAVAEDLFARGLCLPSGSGMTDEDRDRVIKTLRACFSTLS